MRHQTSLLLMTAGLMAGTACGSLEGDVGNGAPPEHVFEGSARPIDLDAVRARGLDALPSDIFKVHLTDVAAGTKIVTVPLPGASKAEHVLLLDDGSPEPRLVRSDIGGGVSWTVDRDYPDLDVVVSTTQEFNLGDIRIIVDHVKYHDDDLDDDGLSNDLEAEIGTCSSKSGYADGFDCSLVADPRDTDGDGISDGWEVMGRTDVSPPQLLPAWGADPRHKDLFIEMDYMLRQPGETPQKLTPARAREFASYYEDTAAPVSPLRQLYRAQTLRNPDGQPGIHVHIDSGVDPVLPEDQTLYGDWGGYTAVPPVMQGGQWVGVNYKTAWKTNMDPARRGIFRYGIPYSSGGGSVGLNSFAFTFGINSAWVGAHELGHGMGLAHSGPAGATGVVDPNCKPNYQSLMNYAYDDGSVSFADGLAAPALNNASLQETNAIPTSNASYLNVLRNKFKYWVDEETGSVDWNRDGYMAPADQRVRAYANFRPGSSCEYTRYNRTRVKNAASRQAPAMERIGNRLYVFYSVLGVLKYNHSNSSWYCPEPSTDACGTWSDSELAYMDAQGGVDVIRIREDGVSKLLVVTIDGDGNIWAAKLFVDSHGKEHWGLPVRIAVESAAGAPSLARLSNTNIMLLYEDQSARLRWREYRPFAGGWQPPHLATRADNGGYIYLKDGASAAVARGYTRWAPALPSFYAAVPENSGMNLWRFDPVSGQWELTDLMETTPTSVTGRPALQWVSKSHSADYPGKFYLVWRRESDDEARMMMSYVKVTDDDQDGELEKTEYIGLSSPFDNTWFNVYGIDLLWERGKDDNLRAVTSSALNNTKNQVWFRPKADGINDFSYTNFNDWERIRLTLCRNVVNPGGTVSDPIACP